MGTAPRRTVVEGSIAMMSRLEALKGLSLSTDGISLHEGLSLAKPTVRLKAPKGLSSSTDGISLHEGPSLAKPTVKLEALKGLSSSTESIGPTE
jgi:hypothetical protein